MLQLSDHNVLTKNVFSTYKVDDVFPKLLILSSNAHSIIVSAKTFLI